MGMREKVTVTRVPHLYPHHSLGQHFLRDPNTARKIIAAVAPQRDEVLVEIGPGEGALTMDLAGLAGRLIIIDIDARVIDRMRSQLAGQGVEIVHQDVLDLDFTALAVREGTLRIVGNIPYNITSPILFHLLDHRAAIRDAVLLMQREVAQRVAGRPGSKEYGILAVSCQLYADVEMLFDIAPTVFYPRPKVTSTLVRLTMLPAPRVVLVDETFFRAMVRAVFGKRRKTLRNSLRYFLPDATDLPTQIDLQRRPESLSLEELALLANDLTHASGPRSTLA